MQNHKAWGGSYMDTLSTSSLATIPSQIHTLRNDGLYISHSWCSMQEPFVLCTCTPLLIPETGSVAGLSCPSSGLIGQALYLADRTVCLRCLRC